MTREPYYNPNATRYPNRHEVVKVIEKWGNDSAPDYSLAAVTNVTASSFVVHFQDHTTGTKLRMYMGLYPNQSASHPGWHIRETTINRLGKDIIIPDEGVEVYSPTLESLMMMFPHNRIVHIDNEDDNWPVFGWAVLGHDGFKAFVQNPRDYNEEEYWKNDELPYATIVTNPDILDRINDDMWAHTMMNVMEGYYGKY